MVYDFDIIIRLYRTMNPLHDYQTNWISTTV
jgi:hypothetical protein